MCRHMSPIVTVEISLLMQFPSAHNWQCPMLSQLTMLYIHAVEEVFGPVFKPFFRLDKSRRLNKLGVALGLAIVEDKIKSHGGNIQLGKSKYNGLQVKVSLPF